MRIQNWTRWHQESDQAQATIRKFSEVSVKSFSYAYTSGWLSSAYLRVIMSLPRAQREEELRMMREETQRLEQQQIIQTLKEPA